MDISEIAQPHSFTDKPKELTPKMCPAEVGDLAALETPVGDWILGEVQKVTKQGRVVKLLDKHNREYHVHTGDKIRIAPIKKLKGKAEAIAAWLESPDTFERWEDAQAYLQPFRKGAT